MAQIDCNQIPQVQLDILSRTLLTAIEAFYSDANNVSRYEEWLESEEGKAYIQRNKNKTRT